jgi:hypothetical protein
MPVNTPTEITETFIIRITEGRFDEAEELIHSDGPFVGTGELLSFFSILFTGFLLQFLLPHVPTEISQITVVEQGPQAAAVQAEIIVTGFFEVEAEIELQTEKTEPSETGTPVQQWQIWDVDVTVV